MQGDENKTLFNVGSVGNPLDATTASYAVLEGVPDADSGPFSIAFSRVAYDIEAEISVAASVGMPEAAEYAVELREGIYRGLQKKPPTSTTTA